ncbi:glycosyltransferase family 39 protein [Patescibacteria group bacterium]|nr:glycosyltransferase family 39 protein [Patescibacteria group bacterium]
MSVKSLRAYIGKHKKEFFLASLATIVQSVVYIVTIFWGRGGFMWFPDSASYLEIAKNLFAHGGFYVNIEWGPQTFRTPLYPIFIAIFYKVIPGVWFVIFIQNILAVINIILTYKLGKLIFSPVAGFLGALFLIFESARLELASQLMTETLFVFFILLTVYYFVKSINENRKLYLIISAVSAGLAALTRPVIQFFPLGIILFFIIFGIARKNIKKCLLSAFLFLMFFAATISPWLIRNYVHFGKWELSSVSSYVFYIYYGSRVLEYQLGLNGKEGSIDIKTVLEEQSFEHLNFKRTDGHDWVLRATRLLEPQYEDYFFEEGMKVFLADVPFYLLVQARKTIIFFIESSASRSYGDALLVGLNLPAKIFYPFLYFGGRVLWITFDLIILAAFIFFPGAFKNKIWYNLFLAGTILYFAVFSGGFSDVGRTRQSADPFIFLFLANAIILFYDKRKNRIKKLAQPAS